MAVPIIMFPMTSSEKYVDFCLDKSRFSYRILNKILLNDSHKLNKSLHVHYYYLLLSLQKKTNSVFSVKLFSHLLLICIIIK